MVNWSLMFQRLFAALKEHFHLWSSAAGNDHEYTQRLQNNGKNTVGGVVSLGFVCLFKNFQITSHNKEPECFVLIPAAWSVTKLYIDIILVYIRLSLKVSASCSSAQTQPLWGKTPQKHVCKESTQRNINSISSTPNSQPQGTAYPILSTPLNSLLKMTQKIWGQITNQRQNRLAGFCHRQRMKSRYQKGTVCTQHFISVYRKQLLETYNRHTCIQEGAGVY